MYNVSPSCQITGLGEIYERLFGDRPGTFVDVGAYDGITYSNTSCLAEAGWEGLMIEPHPKYYGECVQRYAGNPRIRMLNQCIGEFDGKLMLYTAGCLSTTDPQIVKAYESIPWARSLLDDGKVECQVNKLDSILAELPREFEVLGIDTEGTEIDVLRGFSLDWWKPKLVIVEACEHHPEKILAARAPEINEYFAKAGYEKIYCDLINSIYQSP